MILCDGKLKVYDIFGLILYCVKVFEGVIVVSDFE